MQQILPKKEGSNYEVSDIFRMFGEEYRRNNGMTKKQLAVMGAIENCRTSYYGSHLDRCEACGYLSRDYNSCRDRHCPKCQGTARRKWVEARMEDIIPVPYYHVVFTLPHLLNVITSYNKKFVYDLLFSSSSETLLTFGRDPKWIGGELGFYGILHTWGQTMWQHPHVHFIVPGGALTQTSEWISLRYKNKFLFPEAALSQVFRGKFIQGLKEAFYSGQLNLPPGDNNYSSPGAFERWVNRLVSRDWVVYCKSPMKTAEKVVRYIGRYTHRVAISNNRIIDVREGRVDFHYKDYRAYKKTGHLWKTMTLDARDFISRFLKHVLPPGFHKIRHFGYLANGRAKSSVSLIKGFLSVNTDKTEHSADIVNRPCPKCGTGKLFPIAIFGRFHTVVSVSWNLFMNGYAFDSA